MSLSLSLSLERERERACVGGAEASLIRGNHLSNTTCLTLSSNVANNAADSTGRIRQVMPWKTHEAVLDK